MSAPPLPLRYEGDGEFRVPSPHWGGSMSAIPPMAFRWDGETECWATIARFPAYSVSNHGRIRRDALTLGGYGSIRKPHGFLKQRAFQAAISRSRYPCGTNR